MLRLGLRLGLVVKYFRKLSNIFKGCQKLSHAEETVRCRWKLSEAVRCCCCQKLLAAVGARRCRTLREIVRRCQKLSEVLSEAVGSLSDRKACHDVGSLSEACLAAISMVSQAVRVCQAETGSCQTWFEVVRPSQRLSQTLSHCQKLSKTVRGLSSIVRCLSEAPGSCENVSEARQELSDACQELSEAVRDCRGLSEVGAVGSLPEACRKLVDACQGLCREKLSEAVRGSQKFVRRFRRLVRLC